MGRSPWLAGLSVAVLFAGACGSTAKHNGSVVNGTNGGPTTGVISSGAGDNGSASVTTSGADAGGSGAGSSTAAAGGAGSGGSGGVSGGASATGKTPPAVNGAGGGAPAYTAPAKFAPASAPGVTDKTIYVGIGYSSQSGAGDRAIGAAGAAPSYDARNVFNAVADYANAHGGFAGRKVQALYYDYNLTTDTNTQDQSACAYWTQDNKVFALEGSSDILYACSEKAGGITVFAPSAVASTFKKYPHIVDPTGISLERLGQVTVTGLNHSNYFAGKLGLVTWDDPNYRASITQGYLPALSALHITPAETAYIMVPQQIGALGDMTAAVSSAVTKFKAAGIDHVIVQDGHAGVWAGTGLTLEWMNQAKSQRYYPRYGQNGFNSPGWSVLPSDQMDKAIAVSQSDYDSSFDQGWHSNVSRDACYKIEADAGYPVSSGNANDEVIAANSCDFVFFLQRIVNAVPSVTADSVIQAGSGLGTSFGSALIYGTKLAPDRRDGADEFRNEVYSAGCTCLQFLGAPYYAG